MKKLVTACAACLIAGLVSAQIVSQNIVGYQTIATEANKMNTVALQFDGVATGGLPIDIQEIKVGAGFRKTGTDWIKFWDLNTSKYTFAYYNDTVYETVESEDPIPGYEGWTDGNQTKLTRAINPGEAFWVQSLNDSSLIFTYPL
mgnify:CR=1 FL=1